jgi:hypothetical protein
MTKEFKEFTQLIFIFFLLFFITCSFAISFILFIPTLGWSFKYACKTNKYIWCKWIYELT